MELNNWQIEGFANIQAPITYTPKQGAVLWNAGNGTGKTSMISALVWCLFGRTLKNVATSDIPTYEADRVAGFQGTRVIASITLPNGQHLEIARHIKYKGKTWGYVGNDSLLIRIDGELNTDFADKREQDKYIEQVLGIGYETLLNSYIFGQRMQRLAEASPAEQRAQFERLFDLSWVDALKENLAPAEAESTRMLANLEGQLTYAQDNLAALQQDLEEQIVKYNAKLDYYNSQHAILLAAKEEAERLEGLAWEKRSEAFSVHTTNKAAADFAYKQYDEADAAYKNAAKALKDLEAEHETAKQAYQQYTKDAASKLQALEEMREQVDAYNYDPDYCKAEVEALKEAYNKLLDAPDYTTEAQEGMSKALHQLNDANERELIENNSVTSLHKAIENASKPVDPADCNCLSCGRPLEGAYEECLDAQQKRLLLLKEQLVEAEKRQARAKQEQAEAQQKHDEAKAALEKAKELQAEHTESQDKARHVLEGVRKKVSNYHQVYMQMYSAYEKAEAEYTAGAGTSGEVYEATKLKLPVLQQELENAHKKRDELYQAMDTARFNKDQSEQELNIASQAHAEAQLKYNDAENNYKALVKPSEAGIEAAKDQIERVQAGIEAVIATVEKQRLEVKAYALLNKATKASGIKARVIGSLLDGFNTAVNLYGHKLGVNVVFSIDETKASMPFKTSVDILHEGQWRSRDYKALSGGQQQRVSIAVTLGLAELLDSINPSDFIFLDEVFEGLDAAALEDAYNLLRVGRIAHKKVIVISHQQAHGLQLHSETFTMKSGTLTIE